MKKLWNKWLNVVEINNSNISYGNYEAYTKPTDIFYPLILGLLTTIFCSLIFLSLESLNLKTFFATFIFSSIFHYIGFAISFYLNYPKTKKRA